MTDEERLKVIDDQMNGLAERLLFGEPTIHGHNYNSLHGILVDVLSVLTHMRHLMRGRNDG